MSLALSLLQMNLIHIRLKQFQVCVHLTVPSFLRPGIVPQKPRQVSPVRATCSLTPPFLLSSSSLSPGTRCSLFCRLLRGQKNGFRKYSVNRAQIAESWQLDYGLISWREIKLSLFSSATPPPTPLPRRLSLYDCDSSPRPRDSDGTVSPVIYGAAQPQTRVTPSQGYSTPGIGWTRRRRPQLPAQLRDHLEIIPSKPCANTHNAHSPSVISHASTPGASHACLGPTRVPVC